MVVCESEEAVGAPPPRFGAGGRLGPSLPEPLPRSRCQQTACGRGAASGTRVRFVGRAACQPHLPPWSDREEAIPVSQPGSRWITRGQGQMWTRADQQVVEKEAQLAG